MNKSSGVSYINSSRATVQQQDVKLSLVDGIAKQAARDLTELMQSMFDGIDDSLFELANSARTNNEQNRFFEAMREIRIKRKGIESQFSRTILEQFSVNSVLRTTSENEPTQADSLESLSVVGNDQLEEEVAINTMATKAKANFQGPLLKFHTRISRAYGQQGHEDMHAPLEPKGLCEAFSEACQTLEIEIKEKLIVFKQFDRYVMANLEPIIEQANRTLIRHGIMPQLKTPGIRQKHGESHDDYAMRRAQARQHGPRDIEPGEKTDHGIDIFPELQALLADSRSTSRPTQSTTPVRHNYNSVQQATALDTNALLALLNSLQKQTDLTPANSKNAKVIDIRSALQNQLANDTSGRLKQASFSQLDDDLINLVAMLFEFILDDYNLAPPIQVMISRLQIPILKVVIKDKSFFSTNRHPARLFLNSLAKAGIGWGESVDQSRDMLYTKIQQVVHQVLDEFDGDVSLFTRLNEELHHFMEREDRKARIVEQRTKEAEQGRIRSKQAQIKVEEIISNKILNARHPIPQVVSDMLRTGWSRVMFLAYLKDDREHRWNTCTKIVDDLIWCLQPLSEPKDRQRWVSIVPRLLKELKSGLENVSYSTATLDQTMQDIKQELTSAFRNPENILAGGDLPRQTLKKRAGTAVEQQLASRDQGLKEHFDKVDQLKVGQWVEFELLNGSKFRCKLSAKIEEADCYIFVNRMGLKTVEKNRTELARDLSQHKVVFLEQGQVIDRALSAVMSNLKQQKANT